MKIAVAVFGIPRGAGLAYPSIEQHILRPARELGEVGLFGHFFKLDRVVNARSNEDGLLAADNYRVFDDFDLTVEPPLDISQFPGFARIEARGDLYRDGFQSVKNLLHQLTSLRAVTEKVQAFSPDVVIFARPDLRYDNPIRPSVLLSAARHANRCFLPDWQWWNGYNDRIAVCGQRVYPAYGKRINNIDGYLDSMNAALHSEKLLRYTLARADAEVRILSMRAVRIRVNGMAVDENFNVFETLGDNSRWLKPESLYRRLLSRLNL